MDARDDTVEWFDALRSTRPVFYHEAHASWYVTRHADIWALLNDDRLSSRDPMEGIGQIGPQLRHGAMSVARFLSRWPMSCEGDTHRRVHAVLAAMVARSSRQSVAAPVRRAAARGLAELRAGDDGDVMGRLVRPTCVAGLAAWLGLREEQVSKLAPHADHLIQFLGLPLDADVVSGAEEAVATMYSVVHELPVSGAGGAPVLAAALDRGDIDIESAAGALAQILTGTLEPTAVSLAFALQSLSDVPDAATRLAVDPRGFTNEVFRLSTPFHFAPRVATAPLEITGTVIPAGARVVLVLLAGNRDPEVFHRPEEFDESRTTKNLAFGRGVHACLGQSIATTIVAEAAIRTATTAQVSVDVEWQVTMGMRTVTDAQMSLT